VSGASLSLFVLLSFKLKIALLSNTNKDNWHNKAAQTASSQKNNFV
jgi:hypothetical protein